MAEERRARPAIVAGYAAFALSGTGGGVGGVLLPAQLGSYGVGRATIGIMFFVGSAGFALAGLSNGALIQRIGLRLTLAAGGAAYAASGLCLAARPPLAVFMAAQLVMGYGTGVLESALSVYLGAQPDPRRLFNRIHAFFGVGALIGPAFAAWMLGLTSWPTVWLVIGLVTLPLTASFLVIFPRRLAARPEEGAAAGLEPGAPSLEPGAPSPGPQGRESVLLGRALRHPGVLLGTTMLIVYVGLELSIGNWGFSYLVQARGMARAPAGWALSGFWLGLTLGRFIISPIAERLRATTSAMMYACLAGVTAAIGWTWLLPGAAASPGLVLLGFFLGPVFPTTMAVVPLLVPEALRPSAYGIFNVGGAVGGGGLPWLAGVIAQAAGIGTLLPYVLALAALQFTVWLPIARRIRPTAPARPAGAAPSSPVSG